MPPRPRLRALLVLGPSRLSHLETVTMKTHKHTRRLHARTACQRCGTRIPPVARKHGDPFCSRVCAEATYGTHTRSAARQLTIGRLQIRSA